MTILNDISLRTYNTFGIDAKAKHFVSVENLDDLIKVLKLNEYPDKFILGGGSNMLLTQDLDALVIHLNLKGIEVLSSTNDHVIIEAMAGENWHDLVMWCLDQGFGGVENLSLIPGNVGAAPIQNIGAYGVELKDVFVECQALDMRSKQLKTFLKSDCKFDYRNSIFKNEYKGEYIITSIKLRLTKKDHSISTAYGAIQDELERLGISKPGIRDVSEAVINIRQSKLPDPAEIGNSGSFFKNPIIDLMHFNDLRSNFSDIPSYPVSDDQVKIPAGWLIEKAGFKGKRLGNYGVHKKQALVLVNYDDANGKDIFELSQLIQATIKRIFNINLEAEVNII
ncbi:MAG: UDP-N-acetylmuramate dehydrogenase [Flavobacteriaceae bacterium]|nr:UDP-N-acetylmuramate dehydrogenase [Flavobacteriaceae bacterium]